MPNNRETIERVARIIDPGAWSVMDRYLEEAKREFRGQNVGWPADQFQHEPSMKKAREIIDALSALSDMGVSEEMREAGVRAWLDAGGTYADSLELVEPIYLAMQAARLTGLDK